MNRAIISIVLVAAVGCSSSDANNHIKQTGPAKRPGDLGIVPREEVADIYRPITADGSLIEFAASKYDDSNPTHYADGSPAYHADGSAIDYRPRNIQRELRDMPTLFVRDIGQQRMGSDGDPGRPKLVYLEAVEQARVEIRGDPNVVWRDPARGDICWRALTCQNPECVSSDAAPLIFAVSVPGFGTPGAGAVSIEETLAPMCCPRCGRRNTLTKYNPPATISRVASLRAELARIRSARRGE